MSNSAEQRQMADRKLRVQRLEEKIKTYASTFAGWCMSDASWSSGEHEHVQWQYRDICDELVRLLRNQQPGELTCEWSENDKEWSGQCGASYAKTRTVNFMFCPGCGRPMTLSLDATPAHGEQE